MAPRHHHHHRYVLEKRPNLLSATLLLPVVNESATEEDALVVSRQLGTATRTGPFRQPMSHMPAHVPCMKIEPPRQDGVDGSMIRIFAPFVERGKPEEYLAVEMDCKIDVERSILTLQGDHLACRLAFTEYSSARDCREERELKHPSPSELTGKAYSECGIRCRSCQAQLVPALAIERAHRAPRLPWAELVECLTCVNLEEYTADRTFSDYTAATTATAAGQGRVTPEANSVIVSEAHVCVYGRATSAERELALEPYASPPLLLNESEENSKARRWQVARCRECRAWVGDARQKPSEEGEEEELLEEVRLFKFAIETGVLFNAYLPESVLCGAVVDAAFSRECYRFILAHKSTPVMRLVLLSHDSWLATHQHPTLAPCVKLLYWDVNADEETEEEAEAWAERTGAEWIGLPDASLCLAIKLKLHQSTLWLPHSMRSLPDKSRVGFLYW